MNRIRKFTIVRSSFDELQNASTVESVLTFIFSCWNEARLVVRFKQDGAILHMLAEERPGRTSFKKLTSSKYKDLMRMKDERYEVIKKRRHTFEWENRMWALDVFDKPHLEFALISVEEKLPNEDIVFPDFVRKLEEVTGDPNFEYRSLALKDRTSRKRA